MSLILIGLFLSIGFSCQVFAKEKEEIKITNYINDHAGILDSRTESELNQLGKDFEQSTGSQIIVVTVNDLNGQDPMKAAADLGNKYGIGNEELDNGVIILISMEDKQRFMATGSGIQGTLTDIACEHLQQKYLVPAFQEGNYSKGIKDLYMGVMDAIQHGIDENELEAYVQEQKSETWIIFGLIAAAFIGIGTIFAVVLITIFKRYLHMVPGQQLTLHNEDWNLSDPNTLITSNHPEILEVLPNGVVRANKFGSAAVKIKHNDKVRYIYFKIKEESDPAEVLDQKMNFFFQYSIQIDNGSSGHSSGDDDFFTGSSGGSSGFSGGGGSFNGGGSGGSW